MAKDDDIVWLMVYHLPSDTIMALPMWKHSPSFSQACKYYFVTDKEMADKHNANLDEYSHRWLDQQLTARWEIIAEQRKGRS